MFSDAQAFSRGVRRLRAESGAVSVWNVDRTFRVLLRTSGIDPDDPESELVNDVEVAVIRNDHVARAIDLDYDGYLTDDEYVLDELNIDDPKTMAFVNGVLSWRVCKCGEQFIKSPDRETCVVCDMHTTTGDTPTASCCVCLDAVAACASRPLLCCGGKQTICRACLARLERCPCCRANFYQANSDISH